MPNLPELQSEAVKWQRRLSLLASKGVNTAPAQELAKTDLQRLIQGGSPLAENQIVSMVTSAYTGQVTTPQASGSADWNPLHILGSIGKDVSTDVRSFMPGLIHEGADIINPNKWAQVPGDLGAAVGDIAKGNIGDAAKQIVATPIVGSLIPGAFAASGGWKGLTDHPLNTLLSVLPIVSTGSKLLTAGADTAEAGTALSALKEGHPIQAVARATGLESRLMRAIENSSGPTSQFAHMPVWRAYNQLARVYARRLASEAITSLKDSGLVGKGLSAEDSQRLVIDAQAYNPRFENKAVSGPTPEQVAQSGGDVTTLLSNVPSGRDVIAYAVTANPDFITESGVTSATSFIDQTQIFWDPKSAVQSLGPDMEQYSKDFVHEVRVNPGDVTQQDGTWVGKNVVPNRTYVSGEGKQLQAIRDFSSRYQEKSTKPRPNALGITSKDKKSLKVYLPNPITGKTEVYDRSSGIFKSYLHAQSASKDVTKDTQRLGAARARVQEAENVTAGRTETYAKYGESEADAAKRPPTVPSVQGLYQVAQEYIIQGMYGAHRTAYEQLDKAFQLDSPRKIKSALTRLKFELRKDGSASGNQHSYASYLYEATRGLGVAATKAEGGMAKLVRARSAVDAADKALTISKRNAESAHKAYMDELTANPPDRFHPLIQEQARGQMINNATQNFLKSSAKVRLETQGAGVAQAIAELHDAYTTLVSHITDAHTKEDLANFVDAKTLEKVEQNAFQDWVQMSKAGYDPIWTHDLSQQHYDNMTFGEIRPLPLRIADPASAKAANLSIFDFKPQVLDIGAVLTSHAVDYLQNEASKQFVDFLINKSGTIHIRSDIQADMEKRFGVHADTMIEREFVPFDPHQYIPTWKGAPGDVYMIPKSIKKGFDMLMEGDKMPLHAIREPLHRMFKVSVLTGPRHMVHVGVGGLVMTGLQDPGAAIELIAHAPAIFKLARDGKIAPEIARLGIPSNIRDALSKGNYEERVDSIMQLRAGMKHGEWWRQSKLRQGMVNTEQNVSQLENTVTDMYRAATYLHQMKNGATNEAALALVNKTLVDVDNMTPFEKTVIKQIFPFWTYTKHILRYVMTYPSDHPLRASILSSIANHVETTNASGDPARLSKLFMIGSPDASGKIETVDMSNLNPFRSMSSVFSMSGFLMGLAPEFQTGLKALGINPVTGTTSMHQNYTYDAYTGTNIATRPKLNPLDFASTFIPQVEVLDHFLLFTDTMRKLKQNNPEQYQRTLYQEMNLPFAVAPINIYDIRAKAAASQFRDAQTAVTNAMATGNTSAIRTFESVPFQGYLYPADQVANYIDNFDKLMPGIAPKAVYKAPKKRKTKAVL